MPGTGGHRPDGDEIAKDAGKIPSTQSHATQYTYLIPSETMKTSFNTNNSEINLKEINMEE